MIDYARLGRSVDYYAGLPKPFTRIEVPWTVSNAVSDITRPADRTNYELVGKSKSLVASGEQGFFYLALKGFLPPGRYQAVTPCFRDEPFDLTHTKYFMKNELLVTDFSSASADLILLDIVAAARSFFVAETNCKVTTVQEREHEVDLLINGHEVGSYGIRETPFLRWVYGTGLAEPRFTMAVHSV